MGRQEQSAEQRDQRDALLIQAIERSGQADRAALAELLTRHENRIYSICVRLVGDRETAHDLAQDTMVKVIEGLDSFDRRAKFTTWLTRVTMNVCISYLRKQRVRRSTSLSQTREPTSSGGTGVSPVIGAPHGRDGRATEDNPAHWGDSQAQGREPLAHDRVESEETMDRLRQAIAELDPDQRGILVLRDGQGLDYRQIGEALGIAVGTVKSRLFRARAALREAIERRERSEPACSGGTGVSPAHGRGGRATEDNPVRQDEHRNDHRKQQ